MLGARVEPAFVVFSDTRPEDYPATEEHAEVVDLVRGAEVVELLGEITLWEFDKKEN